MLTSEHTIVKYEAGRAIPDRLTQAAHRHYLEYAERMLEVYRRGVGRQRRQLHRAVEQVLEQEPDCPIRRIQAFCKLLDDASTYRTDRRGQAAKLRLRVFTAAAPLHPLVSQPDRLFESDQAQAKQRIAAELGEPWERIERRLYADVMAFQTLEAFEGYPGPLALLSRYNVAQLQACLYRAERMVVTATDDFKTVLRYSKLARLLHEIEPVVGGAFRITLAGPASVLRETRRYGVNFARFLPALLACAGWEMTATIQTPWQARATLKLSDRDGFTSHLPTPEDFDSAVEESFAGKFGPEQAGWRLCREGTILHDRQAAFVPDFVFRHADGTEVLMEIVGFWTNEYLAKKRQTLRRFADKRILLALPEKSLRERPTQGDPDGPGAADGAGTAGWRMVTYKSVLKVAPVLEALERIRAEAGPPAS